TPSATKCAHSAAIAAPQASSTRRTFWLRPAAASVATSWLGRTMRRSNSSRGLETRLGLRPVLGPERGLLLAVHVREAVPARELRSGEDPARLREDIGVGGERCDRAAWEFRRFRPCGLLRCQVHSLEPHPAGRDRDARDAVR